MTTLLRTAKQQEIALNLEAEYGIDGTRILFLNPRNPNDPWIPPTILEAIARKFDEYRSSSVAHDKYIPETAQVIYMATVTDSKDRIFTRSGVATFGEVSGERDEIDADILAQGRALSAALNAAGFNPVKSVPMVNFADEAENEKQPRAQFVIEEEAALLKKDLRQIHALAVEKGLIVGKNDIEYRVWLAQHFNVKTSAILDAGDRARVINKLKFYREDFEVDTPHLNRSDYRWRF